MGPKNEDNLFVRDIYGSSTLANIKQTSPINLPTGTWRDKFSARSISVERQPTINEEEGQENQPYNIDTKIEQ